MFGGLLVDCIGLYFNSVVVLVYLMLFDFYLFIFVCYLRWVGVLVCGVFFCCLFVMLLYCIYGTGVLTADLLIVYDCLVDLGY